jgi:nucleotide-binding universal stress UspA family protein
MGAEPGKEGAMRIYLVIMDETEEARVALRFAGRRAAKTGGAVHMLAIVPPQPFVAFAGVQATIEEEARARAEVLLTSAAGNVLAEGGRMPEVSVHQGDAVKIVRDYLADHTEVAALVLGAARDGEPGPLVAHFTGPGLGTLPCPLMIVPGGLSEGEIDRLS